MSDESARLQSLIDQERSRMSRVAELEAENLKLRAALRISTNGLRHCARWNISEEKSRALMAVVIENEALLCQKPRSPRLAPASWSQTIRPSIDQDQPADIRGR